MARNSTLVESEYGKTILMTNLRENKRYRSVNTKSTIWSGDLSLSSVNDFGRHRNKL